MAIKAPERRINPSIQRKGSGRKGVHAGLYLTSMVDMFAILVIFLLQSFSSEGELIILPKGLELPKAQNSGTLERAASLVVSQEEISFEGEVIMKTADLNAQEEWFVAPLNEKLKAYKEKLVAEAKVRELAGADEAEALKLKGLPEKINISVDRRLPFSIVKKVIYNAGFAGLPDFRFAVYGGAPAPAVH